MALLARQYRCCLFIYHKLLRFSCTRVPWYNLILAYGAPPPRGPSSPPLHPFGKMDAIFFLFPLKVLESHGAESCSCRAEIVFCVTSSTATHATTALSFSITCTLVLERQPRKTLIRVILLAIHLDWIYYFVPVGYFLGFAHFFAPLWNVSKEVACLTFFLTTSTIANACSFSNDKIPLCQLSTIRKFK